MAARAARTPNPSKHTPATALSNNPRRVAFIVLTLLSAVECASYIYCISLCCIALNSKINMICGPTHHYGLRQKVTAESAR